MLSEEDRLRVRDKKKRRRRIAVLALVTVIIAVLSVVCLNVFIVANKITVANNTPYDTQLLLESCGVTYGQSLLGINSKRIFNNITDKYPYVRTVEASTGFPDSVTISFIVASVRYVAESTDGNYLYLDSDMKVLETVDVADKSFCLVSGLIIDEYSVGKTVSETDSLELALIDSVMSAAEKTGLSENITGMSIEKKYDITVTLNDVIIVELGTGENLDKKFSTAKIIYDLHPSHVAANINVRNYEEGKYRLLSEN